MVKFAHIANGKFTRKWNTRKCSNIIAFYVDLYFCCCCCGNCRSVRWHLWKMIGYKRESDIMFFVVCLQCNQSTCTDRVRSFGREVKIKNKRNLLIFFFCGVYYLLGCRIFIYLAASVMLTNIRSSNAMHLRRNTLT